MGVGDTFAIHVNWLFEGGGYESSYAPVPAGSHADSYDPDYSQVFVFDRRLQAAPADAVPAP